MRLARARGLRLDRAIALHELTPEGRQPRPAAMRAAELGGHDLAAEIEIHLLDQHPSPAIGHAELAAGAADRTAIGHRFEQPDLARADRLAGPEIDAQGET